ncbi:TPA: hypothetical protein ACJIVJ_000230 [Yersinia enterocolitica]|uniref:hypothetical protein n=1 Tax=Yersinia sp. 2105 StPb PI TaxID=2507058 RepID=UPI001D12FED4|nr:MULTISPECIES: hypothetical protein [Yersinia]
MLKNQKIISHIVLGTLLGAISMASYATESIDQLSTRIDIDHFREGIKKGDRSAFKTLPAKGYKNGLTGLLLKTNTYVNPEYSFADCDTDTVIASVQEHKTLPGCRISLKLATKDADGSYHDNGIRIEYGITTGSKKFIANNSVWAQHAISGDKVLEISLKREANDTVCTAWSTMAKNMAIGRDEHNPISVYQQQIENLRGKPGITESNIVFAHALAGMVYQDMAAKKPQEVEALVYQTCQLGM